MPKTILLTLALLFSLAGNVWQADEIIVLN